MIRHIALAAVAALSLSAVACAVPTESPSTIGAEETAVSQDQDLVSKDCHFETFTGSDDQHYFRLVAKNGANLLRSESYATAASVRAGIASVLANGTDERNIDLREASNGTFYFNVKAQNGVIIATSGFYARKDSAQRGSRTVRALVRVARNEAQQNPVAAAAREQFETFTGEDGNTYFHLRAANGELLLDSEGYATKANALRAIETIKAAGTQTSSYEIFATADDTWGVSLVAANGEIIATGESYATRSNATRAVSRIAEILAQDLATTSF